MDFILGAISVINLVHQDLALWIRLVIIIDDVI